MRILVRNHGPDERGVAWGFAAGIKVCEELGLKELTVVVPNKGQFVTTVVGQFLKEPVAKRLAEGDAVKLNATIALRCESIATIQKAGRVRAALVFYVDGKGMKMIDGLAGIEGIVYVPWVEEEGDSWQRTWSADVLGEQVEPREPDLDPRAVTALEGLTRSVNLSTGLGHPSDAEHAKRMFKELRAQGVPIAPAEVEIWAVRHNWRPEFAVRLREMAERFAGG